MGSYRSICRQLKNSPGFVATVVLILAIGIGVTTAMYSVLYAVILQPLPFAQPDRLVAISAKPWSFFSVPTIQDWQKRGQAFQSIAAFAGWSPRVESAGGNAHAKAILVSQNFVSTLGAPLKLGRGFTQTGHEADCLAEAIVSPGFWQRMGGGISITGKTLRLDHNSYAIAGVLSRELEGEDTLNEPGILTTIGCDPAKGPEQRGESSFEAIGRLSADVSLGEAGAEIVSTQQSIANDYRNYYPAGLKPVLIPLAGYMTGTATRTALFATMAGCGMLLMISCSNLGNLILARHTRRRPEFALRAALGATQRHFVWQILLENGSLALAGAGFGVMLALILVRLVAQVTVIHLPRLADTSLNLPAMIFAALITLSVALVLTLLPAAGKMRGDLLSDLSSGNARTSSASSHLRDAGRILVASQLALALVLVASAGWMVSSVLILLYQPLGFEPSHLLIASTDLRGPVPQISVQPARTLSVLQAALNNLHALPGVVDVAAANDKPLGGRVNRYNFCVDLHPEACHEPSLLAPDVFLVTPAYFRAVGQQVLRGREFNAADDGRDHVAIVNRALAVQQWPRESPLGHRIYSGDLHAWATVIGEVADVHSYSLERAPVPNLYLPEADTPDTSITMMVRTKDDPVLMEETMRMTLKCDSQISVRYVETMPELMGHQVALRRFSMWVAAAFGALALTIAVLGTYGLIAYDVSLREREIGIRLALGSSRSAIVSLLLVQESRWILGGIALGLAGAMIAGFLLRAEFFHTGAATAPVLIGALLLLGLPALAAVAIPGWRTSLLDPAVTLRRE